MAIVINDNRSIVTESDATTGWSSGTLFTTNPNPVETTGSVGFVVSNAKVAITYTLASATDISGGLLSMWMLPQGIMDTYALGGCAIYVLDGTNSILYHVGGSDVAGFRHNDASISWQCFVIDADNPPTTFTVNAGSEAALDWTAVTHVGVSFKTLVKAVGGVSNCFVDITRHIGTNGNDIYITGGGTGTEGTFAEIAIGDGSNADQQAFGVIHEVASGVMGVQAPITFGDVNGTGSLDFLSTSETLVFEDRGFATDKYVIKVVGNSTGTTSFQCGTKVGTIGGSSGVNFVSPLGIGAAFDASDTNVEYNLLYGTSFTNFDQTMKFSADATNGPNHEVLACTFNNCAQIDPGQVIFKNNIINGSADATGAVLLDSDGTNDWSDLVFTSDGTGHAIYIPSGATGSYTFTNMFFNNYGSTGTTNASVYNNSGGAVSITISGGESPTYYNGSGASTTIISGSVSVYAKATTKTGTAVATALVLLRASNGTGPFPYDETVTIVNSGTTATVTHTAHGMATGDYVQITQGTLAANRGVFQITVTGVDTYTYTMTSTPGSSPTGTIKSTFVALYGTTDVNGEISTNRVYASDQPVIGWTRKSSASPYLQEGVLTGSVSSTTGFTGSAVMVSDE